MRAKKTNTEVRQEQIEQAALHLIGTDGIHSLSISRIAESVGIVPSAVYRHFKSKEDVLDLVLKHIGERLVNNVAAARKESADSVDCLKSLMIRHAGMLEENRAIPHVIFSDSFYTGNPDRKGMVKNVIFNYLAKIEDIIQQGQEMKNIRKEIDAKTLSVMFLGMVLPAAVLWNVSDGKFDISEHVTKAWPAFKRSILPDP
ncbi:MAG: TetR/AcrR family transcriptional regulator [Proteobacteria bacterium]|nr:TetR/AcrR family transcriptional regulator [Pseudomonadota bacterium]MBU4469426.1 TetR/AcrR family transcriptional regulator [Pseudomonadota bacterium]MCG2752327.1 TetR/AcrR family transcriptional regulator [Desulfobacteraceae bacterium]